MTRAAENYDNASDPNPPADLEMARMHGLSDEEWAHLEQRLGRTPNLTELGITSALWSEHCSYKTSKIHLKKLPTEGPQVIQGPGENAGVVDIGDNQALVFKMESHNHPSYIEPVQGAATGVGGILRDVFTMGARPFALIDALRFGDPSHPRTRYLVGGVAEGIAGYGNSIGIPTVGGETQFDPSYNGNILVNAMAVGLADQDKIFYARGAKAGQTVLYVGSKTGRDGMNAAVMASAGFSSEKAAERPTVQVGDPFTEKRLMEACLELMAAGAVVAIQDMGAAGLTSSSCEMAAKSELGIRLDLDRVPCREEGMTPYEMMLSESQERMLMVLEPEKIETAHAIFRKWDLDSVDIGRTNESGHLECWFHGELYAELPIPLLVDEAPVYDRPRTPRAVPHKRTQDAEIQEELGEEKVAAALMQLLGSPDLASKRWIWEQYDRLIGADTFSSAGHIHEGLDRFKADAAILRIPGSERKGVALTSDCTPRYVYADPFVGGMQAVAESYRNLCTCGARPLALTNNLNFGDVKQPAIMAQFADALEGMAEACRVLDYPVISGNVSLYNATDGQSILPTPVIGGVGLLDDIARAVPKGLPRDGLHIYLVGAPRTGHLGQSQFLKDIHFRKGADSGPPPDIDLNAERKLGELLLRLAGESLLAAAHDVSDGGLLVALAEMVLAAPGDLGIELNAQCPWNNAGFAFGEDQAQAVIATDHPEELQDRLKDVALNIVQLGWSVESGVQGPGLRFPGGTALSRKALADQHEAWLPAYMRGEIHSAS